MENVFRTLYKKNNKHVAVISAKALISLETIEPKLLFISDKIQRKEDVERTTEIVEFQKNVHKTNGFFVYHGLITLFRNKNSFFIVDGQHRYQSLKVLQSIKKENIEEIIYPDHDIIVEIIEGTEDDMTSIFSTINKSLPVPAYIINNIKNGNTINNTIIEETFNHFYKKFRLFFKESDEPHIPHINKNKFKEYLGSKRIVEILNIKTSTELINLITTFNNKPIDPSNFTEKQYKKCKEHEFYLGLYQNYKWIDEIIGSERPRKSFSKSKRAKVWDNVIGTKIGCTKCPCCNNHEITQLNFEIGHKISKRRGGSDSLDNLSPVCSDCNKSMGTMNFDEFKRTLL